jgi:hypothetical protein
VICRWRRLGAPVFRGWPGPAAIEAAHGQNHIRDALATWIERVTAGSRQRQTAAATTATAHKIAIIFSTMVNKQVEYDASLWAQRDAMREKRLEVRLHKQAVQRGYTLVPMEPTA